MKTDTMDFLRTVEAHLGAMHLNEARLEIMNPGNLDCIQEEGMELISKVCDVGLQSAVDMNDISACSELINYICNCYNPKLALISTLEQVGNIP